MPEILGAVETRTNSKGYVVAEVGSLNQVLTFQSPSSAAIHEFYHLLGCSHGIDKGDAYRQVRHIKQLAARNRLQGRDFFPAMSEKGRVYSLRADVDRRFGIRQPERAAKTSSGIELVQADAVTGGASTTRVFPEGYAPAD